MTNPTFPWKMDKPVEEILQSFEEMSDKRMFFGFDGCSFTFSRYLLHRLKLAEGERDNRQECLKKIKALLDEQTESTRIEAKIWMLVDRFVMSIV